MQDGQTCVILRALRRSAQCAAAVCAAAEYTHTHLSLLTHCCSAVPAAAAAEEADVLDRLVKLAHSISNRQLADAAPANRHALESELKPLDDQVRCLNHSSLLFVCVDCMSKDYF
jgi:hypothetical protein